MHDGKIIEQNKGRQLSKKIGQGNLQRVLLLGQELKMIKSFKNSWVIVLFVLILFFNNAMLKEKDREKVITLQSTTSTENSGFYDYILPIFFEKTGIKVRVVSAGTGQALKNAANGDGDILITHSKSDEESFVEEV